MYKDLHVMVIILIEIMVTIQDIGNSCVKKLKSNERLLVLL